MTIKKNPGAVEAAHGASETDDLGRRVDSQNILAGIRTQAPIDLAPPPKGGSKVHRAHVGAAGGIATDAKPQADKSQSDTFRIIIERTKSGRKWVARLDDRVLCVAAAPFVKSARLLLAEGYPAHSFIEMWRSNTAEWALRGRLGAVAATVLDGDKAPRDAKNGSPVQDLARGGTGAPCPIPLTPIGAVGRSKRARR
jgi:hypothetical protein